MTAEYKEEIRQKIQSVTRCDIGEIHPDMFVTPDKGVYVEVVDRTEGAMPSAISFILPMPKQPNTMTPDQKAIVRILARRVQYVFSQN